MRSLDCDLNPKWFIYFMNDKNPLLDRGFAFTSGLKDPVVPWLWV
jgi:hypothetical protein